MCTESCIQSPKRLQKQGRKACKTCIVQKPPQSNQSFNHNITLQLYANTLTTITVTTKMKTTAQSCTHRYIYILAIHYNKIPTNHLINHTHAHTYRTHARTRANRTVDEVGLLMSKRRGQTSETVWKTEEREHVVRWKANCSRLKGLDRHKQMIQEYMTWVLKRVDICF